MAYYPDSQTDKLLAKLEKRIRSEYKQAWQEVSDKLNDYYSGWDEVRNGRVIHHKGLAERYDEEYQAYRDGKYTKEQFDAWYRSQIGRGERWDTVRNQMLDRMTNANEVASAYINDTTPNIYTLNHNYSLYEIEQNSGISFSIVDENTIKRLMMDENHHTFKIKGEEDFTPFRKAVIDRKADYNWNEKRITRALTQGVLQGESPYQIADRFYTVMGSNYTSAIRNARTSVTSAQNGGRQDSYKKASDMGIEILKEWMATLDDRTRSSHQHMDGERVPQDQPFSNDLMYPSDPDGEPSEVYNCRCTMVAVFPEINDSIERVPYDDWVKGKTLEDVRKEAEEKASIRTDSFNKPHLVSTLGQDFCDGMNKTLEASGNDDMIKLFDKYSNDLKVVEADRRSGACFKPTSGGIYINAKNVAKGNSYERPYQTAFHEFGHNIDWLAGGKKHSAYYSSSNNCELYKEMQKDWKNLVKEASDKYGKKLTGSDRMDYVCMMLKGEAGTYSNPNFDYIVSNVSDSLESVGNGSYPLGFGHGKAYWKSDYWSSKSDKACKEFFAEYIDSMCSNKESYEFTKRCFPKACNVMDKLIKGLVGGK